MSMMKMKRRTTIVTTLLLFAMHGCACAKLHESSSTLENSALWNMHPYPDAPTTSRTTRALDKIDLNALEQGFEEKKALETLNADESDSETADYVMDNLLQPQSLKATIDIEMAPVPRLLHTSEIPIFTSAVKYFYDQLFAAQDEYDLVIRSVNAIDQGRVKRVSADVITIRTVFEVNFRPNEHSKLKILTDSDLRKILIHLMDQFEPYMTEYLSKQDQNDSQIFHKVESVKGSFDAKAEAERLKDSSNNEDGFSSTWEANKGSIITIAVSSTILVVFFAASCFIYR